MCEVGKNGTPFEQQGKNENRYKKEFFHGVQDNKILIVNVLKKQKVINSSS